MTYCQPHFIYWILPLWETFVVSWTAWGWVYIPFPTCESESTRLIYLRILYISGFFVEIQVRVTYGGQIVIYWNGSIPCSGYKVCLVKWASFPESVSSLWAMILVSELAFFISYRVTWYFINNLYKEFGNRIPSLPFFLWVIYFSHLLNSSFLSLCRDGILQIVIAAKLPLVIYSVQVVRDLKPPIMAPN